MHPQDVISDILPRCRFYHMPLCAGTKIYLRKVGFIPPSPFTSHCCPKFKQSWERNIEPPGLDCYNKATFILTWSTGGRSDCWIQSINIVTQVYRPLQTAIEIKNKNTTWYSAELSKKKNIWSTHEVCKQTYSWWPVHNCHRHLYDLSTCMLAQAECRAKVFWLRDLDLWPMTLIF